MILVELERQLSDGIAALLMYIQYSITPYAQVSFWEKQRKSVFRIEILKRIRYNKAEYTLIGKEYRMQALKNFGFRHKAGVIMSVSISAR